MNAAPTVDDMMVAYARDAVDYCREKFALTLDYSEASVEKLEDALSRLHEQMPRGLFGRLFRKGPSAQTLDILTKMMGGYVGEVMKRHWGGRWKLESAAFPGQQVITFELASGGDIWPQFKAGKRIVNGPEDNVWHYFMVLRKDAPHLRGEAQ